MKIQLVRCLVSAVVLAGGTASAAPITWVIEGPADPVGFQWTSTVPVSTPVSLAFTFDPALAVQNSVCNANGAGSYSLPSSATVTFPNFVLSFLGAVALLTRARTVFDADGR